MSHGKLREDKTCLNCGHFVEERFCPHCGQENTENRQPFHYLFTHFFEDFTHYDGQFWKTMKYLMFYPGKLTKIFLSGKRQGYVPPEKLYIFISFVTFFIASFVGTNSHSKNSGNVSLDSLQKEILKKEINQDLLANGSNGVLDSSKLNSQLDRVFRLDSIQNDPDADLSKTKLFDFNSLAEYDSISLDNPSFIRKIFRPYVNKYFELKDKQVPLNKIAQSFVSIFMHTFPKALFFYLPIFAFILYLFHDKKKWWYYDHGVFTLHYFSFLLMIATLFLIMNLIEPSLHAYVWFNHLSTWIYTIAMIYAGIYFFIAHHRFYATRKRRSILIGILVFIVNSFVFSILLMILVSISLLLIH